MKTTFVKASLLGLIAAASPVIQGDPNDFDLRPPVSAITQPSEVSKRAFQDIGVISKVMVKDGDLVAQDQVLLQLDDDFDQAQVQQLKVEADSTARILDVKYHVLLPSVTDVGGAVDYYQWAALLRSVSGFRAYRKIYRNVIVPKRVAELLILREDMPRSLLACFTELTDNLAGLRDLYRRDYESTRLALEVHSKLKFGRMEDIFTQGLHEYLTEFIDRNIALGHAIHRDFMK